MRKIWLVRAILFCMVIFFTVACCQENSDCPSDSYCVKAPGDCEGEGVCIEKSSVPCDVVTGPVCGCDGKVYDNVCEAAEAGVSVTNEGECTEGCNGNGNCEEGYYCEKSVGDCEGRGVCTEMSMGCPDVWDPVCGCDGETYGNACEAGAAGVTIADEGACDQGCRTNDACADGEYCIKRVGDCEGEGVCTEMPMACPEIYDPVCGCDGKTYGNACEAGAAGVTIADEGACDQGCRTNDACADGEYCIKRVGDCEGEGRCQQKPEVCPEIYDPVCGCDGKTYGNACEAGAAGVTIADQGACDQDCRTNDACADGEYCIKRVGDCEGEGRCQQKPEVCPEIYDPVCGCDGKTYGNACEAGAAGVTIADAGACDQDCRTNDACADGEYCIKRVGDCEGEGRCQQKPEVCPEIYDPVCGCDGKTYGNACEAGAAGVTIADAGACDQGCRTNDACSVDEYCIKRVGDCEGEGRCQLKPEVCPDVWDPVCGCDGKTYGNACEAGAAGVTIADAGACDQGCRTNDACSVDEYCIKRVGDCEGEGVCTEMPMVCPDVWDPVCGCDGKTYGNACAAGAAGVTIADAGACDQGCRTNDACSVDEYCIKRVGDCEGEGVCTEMPMVCPDIWDPVCGCDGKTYGNACEAGAAGVTIADAGACDQGCRANDACSDGEYCIKRVGDCEGEGVCTEMPMGCPEIYDPVCGCDGKTYGNACEAGAAGVNVDYEGECKDIFCPRSKGYWKNHPEGWPVDELLIGGELYTKEELLVKLKSPSKGDMELILIKQLIPAKLNKAAGADTSSIDRVIHQADDCLESGECSRNRLEDLKDKLDRFNNSGDDCDDDDEDEDDANSQRSFLFLQILRWLFN